MNIDYQMLQEQIDFLALLATDIELGYVVLPEKYNTLDASPVEYIDGVCSLLDHLTDIEIDHSGTDYSGNLPKDEV